jgi:hypothetical protein
MDSFIGGGSQEHRVMALKHLLMAVKKAVSLSELKGKEKAA